MKFILPFLLTLFAAACGNISSEKPAGLIDADKMSVILEDVLLLESHYQSKYGVPGVYKDALDESVNKVLKKHGVSTKQFQTSYRYFASHPEEFKALNTRIMDRLSREIP
jgi:hypothetical protein